MTIYQKMKALFAKAEIEGRYQTFESNETESSLPDVYCDYRIVSDGSALMADDLEIAHRYDLYIDIHGKRDVSAALDRLLSTLKADNFDVSAARHLDGMNGSKYKYHRRIIATYYDFEMEE